MVDKTVATGVGLVLVPIAAYIIDFFLQYRGLVEGAERMNVLNIRVALFLPLYAFFMMIGLASPDAIPALNIPLSLVESYSFYCFFVLLVTNLGGSNKFLETMVAVNREIMCCNPCCPADMKGMYEGARKGLWHIIVTRNIAVVIAAIAHYSGTKAGNAVYTLLSAICTILLINGLMRCFLIFELVYDKVSNVFNVFKVSLMKISITLIVLQGLICEFMITFNAEPYTDDDGRSAEDKTYRGYCILVLIQYAILTVPYLLLWAARVDPPAASMGEKAVTTAPLTLTSYLCRVLTLWDIFGILSLDTDLSKPLSSNAV